MQIFFLSKEWTIALCFIVWPVFQVASVILCLKIPNRYFSSSGILFKERKWERKGKFYVKVCRVKKWKRFLPDGGAMIRGGYSKKNLSDYSRENLELFIVESCRAELSHLLSILPFWIFGLFAPSIVILYMLIYALVVNLPCIIAQRYNRPRILRVFKNRIG